MRFLNGFIFIFLVSCGGGGSSQSSETWTGSVSFVRSGCDLIQSEPPAISPSQLFTHDVTAGTNSGDSVSLISDGEHEYAGVMTGADSFLVNNIDEAPSLDSPSAVAYENMTSSTARVTLMFVRNAPHGCTHYFEGDFTRHSD